MPITKKPRVCDYCGKGCGPVSEVRGTQDDWSFDGSYYHARCLPEAPKPEEPTGSRRSAATHPDPTDDTMDNRSIRDICVSLDKKLDKLTDTSPLTKGKHKRIVRLNESARDALDIAVEDIDTPFTIQALMEAMNDLSPGCINKGGDQCDSIRAYLLEGCGMKVRYSSKLGAR